MVIAAVFCLIFVLAHRAIFDLDIWLHLKAGEYIAQNTTVPSTDIFSFTLQGKPWIDHSWLFQLLSYLIYDKWQAEGLIFLQGAVITLSFLVLFLIGYKTAGSYIEPAILTLWVAYASTSRFNIRPDIFSVFFFVLYLYLLRFHIDKKAIWLLVPLQVLWVNIHGYFFLGPLLILVFLKKKNLVLLFSTIFASLLNPYGFKGLLYPFSVFKESLLGKNQIFFKYIQELQPTFDSSGVLSNYFYSLVIVCFLLMAVNFKKLKPREIFLVIFFFLFSFTRRHVIFFSFIAYIIIISYLGLTIKKLSSNIQVKASFRQALYFLFKYGLAVIFIIWLGTRINTALGSTYYDFDSGELKSSLSGIDNKRYPEKAADFILENKIDSNMFNDFNSGAYLIGRLYPKRKVFIDGRTELYGQEFFKRYMDSLNGNAATFKNIIEQYQISAILLNMTSTPMPKIISYIYKNPEWRLVFLDDSAVVFLKNTPSNQELIKKYKIDLNKYTVPAADLKILGLRRIYPSPYIKRASLFNLLEEDALVIAECKQALRIMPNCAQGYHLLGKVYLRKGQYQEALENLRSAAVLLPNNAQMLLDLGACLKELKEYKSAAHTLKGALKLAGRDKELRKKIEDKLSEIKK